MGQFFGYGTTSDIYGNCAPDGGGFLVSGGELHLNAADTYLNKAAGASGKGGGIYVTANGIVTLTNGAYVYYLNQAYDGGGIYADSATIYMEGSSTTLRDNVATRNGGGVCLSNNSTLRSVGARIGQPGGTSIANEAQLGAGLYTANSTVEFDGGYIVNNIASYQGGGIYAVGSTIQLTGATIGGTGNGEANQLETTGAHGVGMYLNNTQATLSNTVVASNTFQTPSAAYGGGAYVGNGSALTLTNSRVERHRPATGLARDSMSVTAQ